MTRYTYHLHICLLTVKIATQMHATVANWARQLTMTGMESGAFGDKLDLIAEGRMKRFQGMYQNM